MFNLGRAIGYLVLNAQGVAQGVRQAIASIHTLDASIKKNQYGAIATSRAYQGMGVAVAAAFAGAIKVAVDWEDALADVQRTTRATATELDAIDKGLRGIASIKPVAPLELAKIAAEAGALGVATPDVVEFTSVVADLVAVTELTADEASSGLARLTGIMGNTVAEFKNVGGAILELGRSTKATDSEILNMSRRIAGAGKVVGLSTDQVLSYAAAIASVGVREEQGGSGISRTFIDIQNAINEAGAELEVFGNLANKSGAEFAEAFRNDAGMATLEVIEGLGRAGDRALPVLNALGITEIRQRDVLLRLAAATQNYADVNVQLRNVLKIGQRSIEDNNLLQSVAERRYETAAAKLAILRNIVFSAANGFGNALLPALKSVISFLTGVAQALDNISPAGRQVVMLAGAMIGLLSAMGVAILSVSVALVQMSNVLAAAGGRLATFGGILKFTLRSTALAAAGLGLYLGYLGIFGDKQNHNNQITEEAVKANEELAAALAGSGEAGQDALNKMSAAVTGLQQAPDILKRIGVSADEVGVLIAGSIPEFSQQVADALQQLRAEGVPGVEEFIKVLVEQRKVWAASALQAQVNRAANQEYTDSIEESTEALKERIKAEQEAWDAADARNQAIIDLVDAEFSQRDAILSLEDAQREYNDAIEEAARHQERVLEATDALADAQDGLSDAQRDLADAEREMARAREEALEDLADAEDDLADANDDRADSLDNILDLERKLQKLRTQDTIRLLTKATNDLIRAQLGLTDANRDLSDAEFYLNYLRERGASARDIADAEFAVAQGRLGVADANDNIVDAEEAIEDARQAQLDLPRQIAAAERELAAARRDAAAALRDINDAEQEVADNRRDVADDRAYIEAQEQVEDAQRGVRDATREVEQATRELADVQRENINNDLAQAQLDLEQAYYRVAEANVEVTKQTALMNGQEWNASHQARALHDELLALSEGLNGDIAANLESAAGRLNAVTPLGARPETPDTSTTDPGMGMSDDPFGSLGQVPTAIEDIPKQAAEKLETGWRDYVIPVASVLLPQLVGSMLAQSGVVRKLGGKILDLASGPLMGGAKVFDKAAFKVGLWIQNGIARANTIISKAGAKIASLISTGLSAASGALRSAGTKAASIIGGALQAAGAALGTAMTAMWATAQSILAAAIPILTAILPYLIVAALVAGIIFVLWKTGIGEKILGAIIDGVKAMAEFFKENWKEILFVLLTGPVGALVLFFKSDFGKNIIGAIWDGIKAAGRLLAGFGKWIWEKLVDAVKAILGINSPSTVFMGIGKDIIQGLWNGIVAIWDLFYKVFVTYPGKILGVFANALSWLFEKGKQIIQGLWDGITNIWDKLWGWITGLAGKIKDAFLGAGSWLLEAGRSIMNGLKNGIEGAARAVGEAVLKPVNWIIDNVINRFMRGIGELAGAIGIDITMPQIDRISLPTQYHEGGVVGKGGQKRRRKGLRPDEEVAVLLKGERVLSRREAKHYKENDPDAVRWIGGLGWPDIPNPIDGIKDVAGDALDRVVEAGRRVAAEVAKPIINGALSLMDGTVGQWGPMGQFVAGYMHEIGGVILKWIEGAENPAAGLSVDMGAVVGNIIDVGQKIKARGFNVSEHPAFGGVDPVHSRNSYHYKGRAIDVNWYPKAEEPGMLDWLEKWIKANVKGIKELLWREAGHYNHLHLAMAKGGVLTGPTNILAGEAGPEAVIPLKRLFQELERMMREAVIPLIEAEGGMSHADMAKYALLSSRLNDVSRLAYATGGSNVGGDDIDINVHTDADPVAIASEVMWQKRTRVR